jgi:hypothetical protein
MGRAGTRAATARLRLAAVVGALALLLAAAGAVATRPAAAGGDGPAIWVEHWCDGSYCDAIAIAGGGAAPNSTVDVVFYHTYDDEPLFSYQAQADDQGQFIAYTKRYDCTKSGDGVDYDVQAWAGVQNLQSSNIVTLTSCWTM